METHTVILIFVIIALNIALTSAINKLNELKNQIKVQIRELPDVLWILDRMRLACPIKENCIFYIDADQENYNLCWRFTFNSQDSRYTSIVRHKDDKNSFLRIVNDAEKAMKRQIDNPRKQF